MIAVLLLALSVLVCAAVTYRYRATRADREAEREWFAEEQAWWAALRNTAH